MSTKYIYKTTVAWVGPVKVTVGGYKEGEETMLVTEDRGWFIRYEGSQEKMFIGHEVPELKVGDRVRVTVEKEA